MAKLTLRNISPKAVISVAFILSILTVGLIYFYLEQNRAAETPSAAMVVLAVKNIPARTVITSDMVQVMQLPPDRIQPGARRGTEGLLGMMTKKPIVAGEQIVDAKLFVSSRELGMTANIPADKRAFTIAVNDISGAQGFAKAGDFVDIIGVFDKANTGESESRVLLENIEVLALNANDGMRENKGNNQGNGQGDVQGSGPEKVLSVTLAVRLSDAALLSLAGEKGKLLLALRPAVTLPYDFFTQSIKMEQVVGHPVQAAPAVPEPAKVSQSAFPPLAAPPAVSEPPAAPSSKEGGITIIRGNRTTVAN